MVSGILRRRSAQAKDATPEGRAGGETDAAERRSGRIGLPQRRREDRRLLTGTGVYIDDVPVEDCLHVAFHRSTHPRARIAGIECAAARALAGVVAVFTGPDVAGLGDLPVNPVIDAVRAPRFPILAGAETMAVGEPIAAVVAESRAAALDAAELIEVSYEPLPAVVALSQAAEGQPLFPDIPGNVAVSNAWTAGDVDATFRRASRVVRVAVEHSRLAPTPLEPRGILAVPNGDDGTLTVWSGCQSPHRARDDLAAITGIDPARLRVIAPDVGGAFGMKASLYPEEVLTVWVADRLGRPAKWIATRADDLVAATHGRGARAEGEVAVGEDGRLLGLRARLHFPLGHWMPFSGAVPVWNAARILPGPYDVAAVAIEARASLANTAPMGIYRGAGRPEAAMLMERLIEAAARETGRDPVSLRLKNLLGRDRFPHRTPTGALLDSGDYPAALEKLCALAGYDGLREERRIRREQGALFGIGLCFYVEPCGQGWESAGVWIEPDGTIVAASGSSAQGQGRDTAFAQIVADRFGVETDRVRIVHGDTAAAPAGIGALASRSTAIGGSAVKQAAEATLEKARRHAARLLQSDPACVAAGPAGFFIASDPSRAVRWDTLATGTGAGEGADREALFRSDVVYHNEGEAWGYGCCLAAVSIEAETGVLRIERLAYVDDAGVVVNPLLAEGQVVGGIAQGLGEALMERVVYDRDGQLLTGSLMDYAVPRAADMPGIRLETMATPSPFNDLGAKGVGEAGTIGAPPAILNAAIDAFAPLGVTDLRMPLTSETIWRAINAARSKE